MGGASREEGQWEEVHVRGGEMGEASRERRGNGRSFT